MAQNSNKTETEIQYLDDTLRAALAEEDLSNPLLMMERVHALWRNWADFHMYITSPEIPTISPPVIHYPEPLNDSDDMEFVYPIHDEGYKLSTSKAAEMYSAGQSMCKLYYTIEKMVYLLVERLKSGGIDEKSEVQVNFAGHILPQRKAFESIINLKYNVVVNNFDPGDWGDQFLANVKNMASKGFGFPSETPRDIFRKSGGRGSRGPRVR